MHILEGEYEMAVGFGPGMEAPSIAARVIARAGIRYKMTHPDSWHYVRPLGGPTLSVMVTRRPWEREAPRSSQPLQPLRPKQRDELMQLFRARYPVVKA